MIKIYPRLEMKAVQIAEELGQIFVDTAGIFSSLNKTQIVFDDEVHMNGLGQKLLALEIYKAILKHGRLNHR